MKRFVFALHLTLLAFLAVALLAPTPSRADDIEDLIAKVRAKAEEAKKQQAEQDGEAEPVAVPTTQYVGWLPLSGPLRDAPPPFAWVQEGEAGASMRGVLQQLRHVAQSPDHLGVVLYLDQPMLSLSQIDELHEGVAEVRKANKKVVAFAESYTLQSYLIACSADRILLQRKGMVELTGLGIEEMYLAGLLDKIGVKADMMQVGDYKGAAEAITRTGPSKEWDENFDKLLDDMWQQMRRRITLSRSKINDKNIDRIIEKTLAMKDGDLVKAGLVDALTERNLKDEMTGTFGDDFLYDENMGSFQPSTEIESPFALFAKMFQDPKAQVHRPSIAVLYAHGAIHSGDSTYGSASPKAGLFAEDSIGSRTMVEALSTARDNAMIKGVVIRIDSPGGSAIASEVIWQAVRECGRKKPVFVSVGPMAASGGYYIACAGDRIYTNANSIIGSIGVVGGKLVMGELYEKIGVNVHRRSRGPNGDMFNSVEPFSQQQRKQLLKAFENVYETFTDRVETGRGKKIADVSKVAQGRLFTGRQCVANGLADKVGGLQVAVADMAIRVGLDVGEYDIVTLPRPMSLQEYLNSIFGAGVTAPRLSSDQLGALEAVRQTLGPQKWSAIVRTLHGAMLLRDERVLTLMPLPFVVK